MVQTKCLRPNFEKRGCLVRVAGATRPRYTYQGGIIPAVAVDTNGQVLNVAYTNEEAFRLTLVTGFAHYYRTSEPDPRQRVQMKGATSGNVQKVLRVLVDCDGDAVQYVVEQTGAACHLGHRSCFFRDVLGDTMSAEVMSPIDPSRLPTADVEVNESLLPAKGVWYGPTA